MINSWDNQLVTSNANAKNYWLIRLERGGHFCPLSSSSSCLWFMNRPKFTDAIKISPFGSIDYLETFSGSRALKSSTAGLLEFFFHFSPSHLIYNIWLRGGGLLGQQSSSQFIAPTWKLNKLDPKLLINYNLFILNYNFIILIIIIENEILYERLNNIINHGFWLSGWPPPHPEGGCMGSRI